MRTTEYQTQRIQSYIEWHKANPQFDIVSKVHQITDTRFIITFAKHTTLLVKITPFGVMSVITEALLYLANGKMNGEDLYLFNQEKKG